MMEKAFWEDVQNNLSQDGRSYGRIVELVKEVRDELCAIAPHSWREEIVEAIDLDVFSQVNFLIPALFLLFPFTCLA